jgi:hypothetical protein
VPGYDDNKEFGNNITHSSAHLPKGCANIAVNRPMSRDGLPHRAILSA